jgi:hypothetical protein
MNTNARSIASAALLGLVAIGTSACGSLSSPAITPSESMTTLMQGWDHWFKLEWSTERGPGGEARIRGYITNEYGGLPSHSDCSGRPSTRLVLSSASGSCGCPKASADTSAHISRSGICRPLTITAFPFGTIRSCRRRLRPRVHEPWSSAPSENVAT